MSATTQRKLLSELPTHERWSEEEYLSFQDNRLVEFSQGWVELLPMPTTTHQLIVSALWTLLSGFISTHDLGTALFAPLRVRLWEGKYREPDIVFMAKSHSHRIGEQFWEGADLVMEVLSDDRQRDLGEKRFDYARAGIPEYWVIDPQLGQITVLILKGERYDVHGEFHRGERATSVLLPGFEVEVNRVVDLRLS